MLLAAPTLRRRMAAFTYEGVLLFGVVMIFGYLYSALTQQRHALEGRIGLQLFLFLVLGIYFAWFWSRGGQTLAMKTWRVRLVTTTGGAVPQGRALARYLVSWVWLLPPFALGHALGWHSGAGLFGLMLLWIVLYALTSFTHPQRQFWHDALCGTRLIPAEVPAGTPVAGVQP